MLSSCMHCPSVPQDVCICEIGNPRESGNISERLKPDHFARTNIQYCIDIKLLIFTQFSPVTSESAVNGHTRLIIRVPFCIPVFQQISGLFRIIVRARDPTVRNHPQGWKIQNTTSITAWNCLDELDKMGYPTIRLTISAWSEWLILIWYGLIVYYDQPKVVLTQPNRVRWFTKTRPVKYPK